MPAVEPSEEVVRVARNPAVRFTTKTEKDEASRSIFVSAGR